MFMLKVIGSLKGALLVARDRSFGWTKTQPNIWKHSDRMVMLVIVLVTRVNYKWNGNSGTQVRTSI